MSSIDDAIARIQEIALALNTIPSAAGGTEMLKSAPTYPVENVEPFPFAVAFIAGGEFMLMNASTLKNFPVIAVEFHFSRLNILQAYKQSDAVAVEFPQRLAGDPQLGGAVETIVAGNDERAPYTARPFVWREQTATQPGLFSHMLRFDLKLKLLRAPISTP